MQAERRSAKSKFINTPIKFLIGAILLLIPLTAWSGSPDLTLPFSQKYRLTCDFTCYSGHTGTDYATPNKTPLLAANNGKVHLHYSKGPGNYGYWIEVDHGNGFTTRYAHLDSYSIDEGGLADRGDQIALSGNSGGPWHQGNGIWRSPHHLHFEVRHNGVAGDPYANHWWSTDPPSLPSEYNEPQSLHFQGLKPQDTQTKQKLIPTLNVHKVRNPDGTEAYDISPHITKLAVTDLNYSLIDGLWIETKKKDKNIPFYAGWHTDEKSLKNQEVMSLSKQIGHYGEISDMVSGRFLGGPEKYLAVLYKGQTRIYFYKTNPSMFLGYLDPYPGVWKPSRKMHITTGDVDKDGRDELLVSHPRYDHIRMFDNFHYSPKGWTMRWIPEELDAHYGQTPVITDIVCMDIDSNGYDELLIATASDDHIFEYFYTRGRGKIRFIKQGYIDGLERYNPQTKAMTVMKFNGLGGMRDYLAVITQGASSKYVFFYWERDLNHAWGGLFSRKGILKSPYNEILEDLTVGNFDGYLGDELALGTKHNDLVYFYGTWDLWKEGVWGGKVLGTQDVNLYNAKLIAQSDKKILLLPNQEKELWVEYQNQGAATWFTSDYRTPNLITDKPFQRKSLFKSLSWNSSYKPTTLANQVKPGQKAKYLFEVRAPKSSKKYKEHFALYNNEKNDLYKNSKVSFEIVVDGLPPSRPKSLRPDIKRSFWAGKATSDITPTFIWEKSKDGLTEVISYLITLDNRTYAIKETKASTPKFTCPRLSEGNHTIIIQAQDKLGNLSDPASYTFVVDVTPPEIPQNLGPDMSESYWVDSATSDIEPTFIWEKSSDSLTGISAYLITLDNKSYSLDFSETSWVCPDLKEGSHTLVLKAKDRVNNISDSVSYDFIVDVSNPEPPSDLEPETGDSQWYTNITSDTAPTFKWEAGSDAYSGLDGYNIKIDSNIQYSVFNIQSWTVPTELPEGEHTIYLASRDKLGHLSDSVSYTFIVDTSSPEGSIVIDSDNLFTNSQDVILTIEASDVSPIVEYSISNNNINWKDYGVTDAAEVAEDIFWSLPLPDGTKAVYIKFKDVFGHQSQAFSDSIILDQTNPSSYINDLPAFHNTLSFLVSWFGLDNLSGIKWFDVQVKDSLTNVWRNWLTKTSLISKIFQGIDGVTYWFRSRALDIAGNQEEYSDQPDTETKVDTTAPEPPTINTPKRNAILNATYDANLDMEGIQVEVAGTAEANSDIQLTINPESDGAGSQQLTTKADQDGNWSIPDVTLSEGENKLEAKSTDAAGNWNTSGEYIVWLDTIAPSVISDLVVVDVTYHSLTFSWTASGDDEDQGTAKEYDIRYSALEINKDNFESAAQISSPPVPEEAGTVQTLTLDDLEPKQIYYIAIKTKDDGENWSGVSNVASDKTKTSADRAEIISTNPSDNALVANGTLTLTITITVYDPEGNTGEKLSGEPMEAEISDTNGELDTGSLDEIQDNGDGTYTLVYTAGKKVGDGKITIKIWDDQAEREMTKRETSLDVTLIPGDPGKAITLDVSPNSIKANGSDVSTVTSGNITDANGNIVADGQKITIWLDNTEAGYITTQDQDPNISGIQVKVSSGKISFKIKSKVWNGYGVASKIANAKAKSVKGSASGSAQITFKDITAPSAPSITQPGNGIITNNKNVTIAGKSEKKSRVLLYKNNSYWYYRYADSNGNWSWTKSMGDGTYTLKAGARDTAGNPKSISSWSNSRTFTVDTQKPTITLSPLSPDPNNDSTPRFTGQASDSRTKIVDIEYKVDSGSWKNVPSFTPAKNVSFAFTLSLGDGGHTVYVRSKDQAGNWSNLASDSFTIDTQKPTITLNALSPDPNNDNTPKFTGKATDSRTKIVQIQYKVDSSSWRNISFSQSTNVSFSFTTFSLSNGSHTVYARSKDQAGNWSSQTQDSFTIDTKKPTIYGFSPANNVTLYHRTVTISANYSDDRSGINTSTAKMKIKVDSGSWQDVTSSCTRTSSKISYTKKWAQENHTYTVYVEVKDKAGNKHSATWSFKIQLVSRYKSKRDSNHRVWRIQPWDYPNVGRVTEPPAPTNWNSLNFNDSAWGLPYDLGSCGWISGAKWLWNDSHPDISETMLLRFTFNLPNVPGLKVADATIKIAIDDATWAYVSGSANEQLFAQQTMGQNPHSYWIKPHLKPGKNVVAFQVSNVNYDTGFINAGLGYEMKVVYEDGP